MLGCLLNHDLNDIEEAVVDYVRALPQDFRGGVERTENSRASARTVSTPSGIGTGYLLKRY
jgi:hypothetical protein